MTDDQLQQMRQEIQEHWASIRQAFYDRLSSKFIDTATAKGVKVCAIPVEGSISLPDFKIIQVKVPHPRFLKIIGRKHPCAEDLANELVAIIRENLPEDYDEYLLEGHALAEIENARQIFLKRLNMVVKALPSRRKGLESSLSSVLTPGTPNPLRISLKQTISQLKYSEVYACEYRNFLRTQTPKGPSPFTAEGARRRGLTDSPEWLPVMTALDKFFRGSNHRRQHLTYEKIAKVLAAVSPGVWGSIDPKVAAKRIKKRLEPKE